MSRSCSRLRRFPKNVGTPKAYHFRNPPPLPVLDALHAAGDVESKAPGDGGRAAKSVDQVRVWVLFAVHGAIKRHV